MALSAFVSIAGNNGLAFNRPSPVDFYLSRYTDTTGKTFTRIDGAGATNATLALTLEFWRARRDGHILLAWTDAIIISWVGASKVDDLRTLNST